MKEELKQIKEEYVELNKKLAELTDEELVRPSCPPGISRAIIRDIVGYILKEEAGLEEGRKK